jgi:AbrB family looped-hinge helix DNA binding protein
MKIEDFVKVGTRGQIVIPKKIREQERIYPKQIMKITDFAGDIRIHRIGKPPVSTSPEEKILENLQSIPFDKDVWEDIKKERHER